MVDVFISYARSNQEIVRRLAEAVTRLGYVVWWDAELPPHLSYSEVITEKVGQAKAVIVVWSAASIGSEWVRAEADLARNQKKLIQTAIDDSMPPMPFNQIQFASLAGWNGEDDHPGWNKVKGSLTALCGAGTDIRTAFPMPGGPPPTALTQPPATVVTARPVTSPPVMPAAQPRRSGLVLGAVIGGALALIAGVGVLALNRGGPAPQTEGAAVATPASGPVRLSREGPVAPPVNPASAPGPAARAAPARTPPPAQQAAATRQPVRQATATPQRRQAMRQQAAMPMRQRRMGQAGGQARRMPARAVRRGY